MRKVTFGRHPGRYVQGVVHAGDYVVTYSTRSQLVGLARLWYDGRSQVGHYNNTAHLRAAPTAIGGRTMVDVQESGPSSVAFHYTELVWGMRYTNVERLDVIGAETGRRVFASVTGSLFGHSVGPIVPWPIRYGGGPRGGLVFQWDIGPALQPGRTWPVADFTVPSTVVSPSAFEPDSLMAVSADQQTLYRLSDFNVLTRWTVAAAAESRHHLDTGGLAVPPGYKYLIATDLAVSPDGRTLYVAWSNLPPGEPDTPVGLSVYDAETRAVRTHFDFPACLLAPSPDGQTLAFLDGFGGAQNKTTLYEIDLD
jgi:hypothetical protein